MVGSRAREIYQNLSGALEGPNSEEADFVGALTLLFKDVALAVEENEQVKWLLGHFQEGWLGFLWTFVIIGLLQ